MDEDYFFMAGGNKSCFFPPVPDVPVEPPSIYAGQTDLLQAANNKAIARIASTFFMVR